MFHEKAFVIPSGRLPVTMRLHVMGADTGFKIDLTQTFPHLDKAPIAEAVIEIRTRAEGAWDEAVVTQRLKAELPEYPAVLSLNEFRQEFSFGTQVPPVTHELGWNGLRLQSADNLHVAQFNRDRFVFSRLQPYKSWEHLEREAMRLWKLHIHVAKPTELQRLGVRFINRIPMAPEATRFEDYIQPHPETPRELNLPFLNFMHRETLVVSGHDYGINLTKTLQMPQDRIGEGVTIIFDVDVFTMRPFSLGRSELERRLTEMRWLKNKSFFGTITSKALEALR